MGIPSVKFLKFGIYDLGSHMRVPNKKILKCFCLGKQINSY